MAQKANFRTNFLEKISSVESGDSLSAEAASQVLKDLILGDLDIDLTKLTRFAVKHQVPQCYRVAVWKFLLGISCCQVEGRVVVEEHRKDEGERLLRSLQIMRKTIAGTQPNFFWPEVKDIVAMIKLGNSSISISALSQPKPISIAENALFYIAQKVFSLCAMSLCSWIDVYWLSLRFSELFGDLLEKNPKHFDDLINGVQAHVKNLRSFHEQRQTSAIGVLAGVSKDDEFPRMRFFSDSSTKKEKKQNFSCIPFHTHFFDYFSNQFTINVWFQSGGALLLSLQPLYKLWDKLSTGESIGELLKFTLIELVNLLSQQWSLPQNPESFSNIDILLNETLTQDIQMRAVNHSIDYVSRMGIYNTRKKF